MIGSVNVPGASGVEFKKHTGNKDNPHAVTKTHVGLGNVDNTSDANKPVSTAQATAIADAKKAGTTAQTNLNSHTGNKSNPHGVTAAQVGARPDTWMPSASDVGADPTGTASSLVGTHNTNTSAHNDIRTLITGLTNRLNALANSDDTTLDQMAEIVAYIKANKALIDSITTSKVNVADIVNNLTTNVANKPLSAAQGVALKALIDAMVVDSAMSASSTNPVQNKVVQAALAQLSADIAGKAPSGHTHSEYMTAANPTGTGSVSVNRASNSSVGSQSVAMGNGCTASGTQSTAIGRFNTASKTGAVALGGASTASANYAVAIGNSANASGSYAVSLGRYNTASGEYSFAMGYHTEALDDQHSQGHYNDTSVALAGTDSGAGSGTAFVIGNGTSSAKSNAFRVDYNGTPYAKSALTTTGCDYAEFFEWLDGNPDAEDRRGYFVTLDGEKIKIAAPGDYILGIISGQPSVVGNGDESWMGRYVFDEFGAFVYEEYEYEEEIHDEETGKITIVKKKGTKYKENPDYDPTQKYIQRADRPEWDYVGMLGVLSVRDDGTCRVNGFCQIAEGGIATAAETGYRVIKRVNDHIVKVIFR